MSTAAKRSHYRLTFVVLAVAAGSFSLLQSMVSPVLFVLQRDLHTDQNTVTWVLTAYLLSASVFTPILGRIGDMIGKEKVLFGVLVALAAGSLLAAVANSIGVMIVARVIQGAGGGVMPLAFGIIRDEFPRDKVSGAVGFIASLLAVGGGLGLVLAGPIVHTLNFHWLFWIPGIIVSVAAIATRFVVPESPVRTPGKVSWVAAALLSAWLVALLVAVSQGRLWGWLSVKVVGLITAAVILAFAWVAVEMRSERPLIDMRMMRIPAVWTTNLVAVLFGFGMFSVFAFVPEFLQTPRSAGYGFGSSITQSGLIMLPQTVAMFAFAILSGRLSGRYGAKLVLIAGAALSIPPFVILAFAHGAIWEIAIATMLMGASFGLAFSAMPNIIVDAVPSHQTGVASGMNANIRTIGGSIGAAVVASIVTSQLQAGGLPKESGYTGAFAMLGGVMVFATASGVLIPKLNVIRDAHQQEQAELAHAALANVAAGTVVGDESE